MRHNPREDHDGDADESQNHSEDVYKRQVSTRAAGFANLWVLDLATRIARALTTGRGGDFRPAWSPNGLSLIHI